jgi:hypothetical protein
MSRLDEQLSDQFHVWEQRGRGWQVFSEPVYPEPPFTPFNGNELIPLTNDDYPFKEHIEDVLCRQTRRTGMLLNSDELTGFVHLPSSAVRSPVVLARNWRHE